jgi:hypothetical protein
MVVDQSRMELAALLGLYYSTISRLVNPVDKHQKKRPDTNVRCPGTYAHFFSDSPRPHSGSPALHFSRWETPAGLNPRDA